jgi:hypothetical protein
MSIVLLHGFTRICTAGAFLVFPPELRPVPSSIMTLDKTVYKTVYKTKRYYDKDGKFAAT